MRFHELNAETFAEYGELLSPQGDLIRQLESVYPVELQVAQSSQTNQLWQYPTSAYLIPHGIGILVVRSEAGFLHKFVLQTPIRLLPGIWFAVLSLQSDFRFDLYSNSARQVMRTDHPMSGSLFQPRLKVDRLHVVMLRQKEEPLTVREARYRCWQLFFVSDGLVNCQIEEQTISLRHNQLLLLPPDQPISFHKVGNRMGLLLVSFEAQLSLRFPLVNQAVSAEGELLNLLQELTEEADSSYPYSEDLMCALTTKLLVILLRSTLLPQKQKALPKSKNAVVETCLSLIEQKLSSKLTKPYLAEKCGVSTNTLLALFKEEMGMGVAEYIKTRRLQKARHLLEEGDYSVTQVSDMLGYCSICYFSSEFKNQFGKNPSDYVKDFRSKGERNRQRGKPFPPIG